MRPQSPKFLQTITTTRIISSPPREARQESCGRLAKVTTYQSRPKATVTTTTYRPTVETRTVKLCTDKKCSGHEALIDQLTLDNNKLNQRIVELQNELDTQVERYDNEQATWMSATIEIESMRKLLEETQRNHQQEITYLNSELSTFKQQYQYQEDQIRFLTSQIKQQDKADALENRIALMTQEIERLQLIVQDKNEFITQQGFRITEQEKQIHILGGEVEEKNNQVHNLKYRDEQFTIELTQSNDIIHELKQEIKQKEDQTQQLLVQKDSLLQTYRDNLQLLEQKLNDTFITSEQKNDEIKRLEDEIATLKNKIQLLEAELNDQNEHNYLLNQQVTLNEQEKENLQLQLEEQAKDHEFKLQSKVDDHEQTRQEKETYLQEIYQLKVQVEIQEKQLNDNNQTINQLTTMVEELTDLKNQQETQLSELVEQNNFIKQTMQESDEKNQILIENLKVQVGKVQSENSQLKDQQNETLVALLDTQAKVLIQISQNEELLTKVDQYQKKLECFEKQVGTEKNELSSLISVLQSQLQELEQQKTKIENTYEELVTAKQDQDKHMAVLQEDQMQQQQEKELLTENQSKLEEKLLLQCLEIERLQQENKKQISELQNQESTIQNLEGKSQQDQIELVVIQQQNQKLESEIKDQETRQKEQLEKLETEIEGLRNDLKYQISLGEELNKKNQFQQHQINHLTDVEQQLRYLNEQTNSQAKNLQRELDSKTESENTLKFKLEKLLEELKIKQLQLNEMDQQVRQIEQNSYQEVNSYEERVSFLGNEVETWKQKFVVLNRDYHRVQEDLMMLQAEFDAFKKRGQDIKNIKESTCFEVRKSSLYKENIDVKASQTSIGRLFKENI